MTLIKAEIKVLSDHITGRLIFWKAHCKKQSNELCQGKRARNQSQDRAIQQNVFFFNLSLLVLQTPLGVKSAKYSSK